MAPSRSPLEEIRAKIAEWGRNAVDAVKDKATQIRDAVTPNTNRSLLRQLTAASDPGATLAIDIPANAVPEGTQVITSGFFPGGSTPTGPVGLNGLDVVGAAFNVDVGIDGFPLDAPAEITMTYSDTYLDDVEPAELSIWRHSDGQWNKLASNVDPSSHSISAVTEQLGTFAIGITPEADRRDQPAP